jgi:hypothetical protein
MLKDTDLSSDEDILSKEVEALFINAVSMSVLPVVAEKDRSKLDYHIKNASGMDLIQDTADKPARLGIKAYIQLTFIGS